MSPSPNSGLSLRGVCSLAKKKGKKEQKKGPGQSTACVSVCARAGSVNCVREQNTDAYSAQSLTGHGFATGVYTGCTLRHQMLC
jgi:hypothetical protein